VTPVTARYRRADDLRAGLPPLLPVHVNSHRFGGGRPRVPARQGAAALFSVLRTGCQWGAVDATAWCRRSAAHERFQGWGEAGVFLQLWQAGGKG
jgi:transposase